MDKGRSRPSRQVVLRLGEALGGPLRKRTELLQAAGLPAVYPQAPIGDDYLAPFRAALDRLHAHLPYPAMVLDAYWTVPMANRACALLYRAVDPGPTRSPPHPARIAADARPRLSLISPCPDDRGTPGDALDAGLSRLYGAT
jgi:hypothetical protein